MARHELHLTEDEIQIKIFPANEGPMAALGKEPVLSVGRLRASFRGDDGLRGRWKVEASFDPNSITVESPEISERDKGKILATVLGKILEVSSHPAIGFEATSMTLLGQGEIDVGGRLTLHGKTRETLLRFTPLGDGELKSELLLRQTDFGITPVSAFMGALRSKDEVRIAIRLRLPPDFLALRS